MEKPEREHPVLGRVRWSERDAWDTEIELLPGSLFQLSLVAEAEGCAADSDTVFQAGADYLVWAREAELRIRARVADDLLECYNTVWADEDPEEGTPPMDRAEFLANLQLSRITLYDDGSASWYYACGDLFAGHGISLLLGPDREFVGTAALVG